MKHVLLKCHLLILLCGFVFILHAEEKNVQVTQSGTLGTLLTDNEKLSVTKLIVTTAEGISLDDADFEVMAAMPKLKELDLSGDKNTKIIGPQDVFANNATLETIKFPANLEGFQPGVFNGSALKGELVFPSTITNPAYFTSRLDNLQGVTAFRFPDSAQNANVKDIDGVVVGWGNSIMKYPCGKESDVYEVPDGITGIMQQAFGDNHKLKTLIVSATVETFQNIGATFRGSDVLESIEVAQENPYFASSGGILIKLETKELFFFPPANKSESLVIDGTQAERMSDSFFSNAFNLKRVVFTEGFKEISYCCFKGSGLSVEYIELPSTIEVVGGEAFVGLKTLNQLICKATTPPFISGRQVLRDANGLNLRFGVPEEALEAYKASAWNLSLANGENKPDGYDYTYNDINACPGDQIVAYNCIVMENGTAESDVCVAGFQVKINADEPSVGMAFSGWISEPLGVSFVNAGATTTYFTMPAHDVIIKANFSVAKPYTIIGATGSQSGMAGVGSMVNLETAATRVVEGQTFYFVEWRVNKGDGVVIENPELANTSFVMIDGEVEIEAIYQVKYMVNITGGFAVFDAFENEVVTITATKRPNMKFVGWTSEDEDLSFEDDKAEITTFVMPAHDVTIKANFEEIQSGIGNALRCEFVICPNPVVDYICLKNADNVHYMICTALGKVVTMGVTNGDNIVVSYLPQGIYYFTANGLTVPFVKR